MSSSAPATTLGLPLFLEDLTGLPTGPTAFTDIYDRPPFIRVVNSFEPAVRRCKMVISTSQTAYNKSGLGEGARETVRAVITVEPGWKGMVKLAGWREEVEWGRWLVRADDKGSNEIIARQFCASDGERYKWTHRGDHSFDNFTSHNRNFTQMHLHEWTCTHLSSSQLIAHYDLKAETEPKYAGSSGNVLTVYEHWTSIAADVVAALMVVRHVYATGGR